MSNKNVVSQSPPTSDAERQNAENFPQNRTASYRWFVFPFSLLLGVTILVGVHYLRPRPIAAIEWSGNQTLHKNFLEREFWSFSESISSKTKKHSEKKVVPLGESLPVQEHRKINLIELSNAIQAIRKNPKISTVAYSWAENGRLHIKIREKQCKAIVRDSFTEKEVTIDEHLSVLNQHSKGKDKQRPHCGQHPLLLTGSFRQSSESFDDATLQDMLDFVERLQDYDPQILRQITAFRQNADQNMTMVFGKIGLRIELPANLRKTQAAKVVASLQYYKKRGFRTGLIDMRGTDTILFPG